MKRNILLPLAVLSTAVVIPVFAGCDMDNQQSKIKEQTPITIPNVEEIPKDYPEDLPPMPHHRRNKTPMPVPLPIRPEPPTK